MSSEQRSPNTTFRKAVDTLDTNVGGRKTAQEKNRIPGNGGSQELFGPMFP